MQRDGSRSNQGMRVAQETHRYRVGLTLHKSKGWQVLDLVGPIKGKQARKIEEMVLAKLWREEIRTGKRAGLKKFDGYTESWLSSDFNPNLISEIVNLSEVV